MQRFLSISLMLLLALSYGKVCAAQSIERKIIIENGQFYFFSIDEETQLATLYSGSITQRLNTAVKRQIPIGRMADEPFNPLCFDINGTELVGINWILNSNNSRYEAIKKLNLKDWKKPRSEWSNEDWAQVSFDQPVLAYNEPWEKMLEENNVLEYTFFDLVSADKPLMIVCNQDNMNLYRYNGTAWDRLLSRPVKFRHYISLLTRGTRIGLADAYGNVFSIDENGLHTAGSSPDSKLRLLIIDKDHNKIYTIPQEAVAAASFSTLQNLIGADAQEITF